MDTVQHTERAHVATNELKRASALDRLFSSQADTLDLIARLNHKTEPVRESRPEEDAEQPDNTPHIHTAVQAQNEINRRLAQLLEEIVL